MFKNEFQGGAYVDLFSVQGKDPLAKVKINGSHTSFRKEFNPDLRTFVLSLDGEPSTTKLIFPKNSKHSLHVIQPFLVFQIFIYSGRSFSLEVSLTDHQNLKQRLIFSNSNREVVVTALHVKMPCSVIKSNVWLNLCLDLNGLLSATTNKFSVLDSFTVSANCCLRRVFSLKSRPESNEDIPRNVYLGDVPTMLQILELESFIKAGINIREGTGRKLQRSANALSSSAERSHIAFGSRTLIRRDSTPREDAITSRPEKPSRNSKKDIDLNNNSSQTQNLQDGNSLLSNKANIVPRPPKQASGRVRKPRIKSADYSKSSTGRIENGVKLSKSADTRARKATLENSVNTERAKDLPKSSKTKIDEKLRPVQMKKKLSKSSVELDAKDFPRLDHENVFSKDCRSKSLSVLPKIKSSNSQNKDVDGIENVLSSLEDNVFVNSSQESYNSLEMGDDVMIEEYLSRRRRGSNCTHDDSLSSSCTASMSNSDLFLYSSRPKSVTSQQFDQSSNDQLNLETYEEAINKGIATKSSVNVDLDKRFVEQQLSSGIGSSLSINEEDEEKRLKSPLISSSPNASVTFTKDSESNRGLSADDSQNISKSSNSDLEDSLNMRENETFNFSRNDNDKMDSENLHITGNNTSNTPRNSSNNNDERIDKISSMNGGEPEISNDLELESINKNHAEMNETYDLIDEKDETENDLPAFHQYRPADSMEADSMSWLRASNDYSDTSETTDLLDLNNNSKVFKKPSTKNTPLRQRLLEQLGSMIVQSKDMDTDDGFSDGSDDTTVAEPPPHFKNYRYQDEMKSICSTIDLSATLPLTPQVGEQALGNGKGGRNNGGGNPLRQSKDEELLDLLFDPVLNCYYDPKTEKYYELS